MLEGNKSRHGLSWDDADTEGTVVVSQPSANPALSAEYSLGAQLSYRKNVVQCALDVEALRSGADTIMFLAAINRAGRTVAGVRAKGPLRSADGSHAVVE